MVGGDYQGIACLLPGVRVCGLTPEQYCPERGLADQIEGSPDNLLYGRLFFDIILFPAAAPR